MPVSLVIFDLGRVLIRICEDWQHACRCAGVAIPQNLPEMTAADRAAIDEIIARYDTGKIDGQTFAREIAPFRGLSAEDAFRAHDAFLRGPYPGIDALLDDLCAAGLKTACLSNTSEHHWRQITDRNDPNFLPLDRLTWRFASHHIGIMKPHPGIYEHIERTTQLPPESILFFDDLDANVVAALKRNWQARQIAHDGDPIAQVRRHLAGCGVLSER
jgi:putative hydrolase of the HAD superfamily